jgi:hypothetical protein
MLAKVAAFQVSVIETDVPIQAIVDCFFSWPFDVQGIKIKPQHL